MIHPSYVELMQVVNSDQTEIGEEPVINSRYSIVIATAKRARQIIGGDDRKGCRQKAAVRSRTGALRRKSQDRRGRRCD